ncbi:SsrA-binding protein SmpB [Acanthopleuribacter pedis]|uniref:SsrA-binding protein n=1 Tax=Acanthopleuribacter pedis TaxID=442870 RepID=A0A8J7QHE7_9BACT|nr:SsrA-binding protein SmpB [Acanthopleuribacter pedis]MBO1320516.1 SsrA-binding protein SmpB [Acanthopleuribacter pedis]
MAVKIIAENRKARHDYEILEKVEVGLQLQGSEVKSLREGRANLTDGHARFKDNEAWLISVHVSPYVNGGYANHDPLRPRKILMHRRELDRWMGKIKTKGLAVVPLKLYFNKRGFVKCELALARGKKLHDKRETLKRKVMDREAQAAIKSRRGG